MDFSATSNRTLRDMFSNLYEVNIVEKYFPSTGNQTGPAVPLLRRPVMPSPRTLLEASRNAIWNLARHKLVPHKSWVQKCKVSIQGFMQNLPGTVSPSDRQMAVALRSTRESTLCGLPEDLMMQILVYLSPSSLYALQKSSTTFDKACHALCLSYQKESIQGNMISSSLCTLPPEVLLKIMHHLSPASLYIFRQSSVVFMTLFDDFTFRSLQAKPTLKTRHRKFLLDSMSSAGQDRTAQVLSQDYACSKCREFRQNGNLHAGLARLRESQWCCGCKERHASIYFSSDSMAEHNSGGTDELVCIGRLGRASLCSHIPQGITWADVERHIYQTYDSPPQHVKEWKGRWTPEDLDVWSRESRNSREIRACADLSHQPSGKRKNRLGGSAFPCFLMHRQSKSCRINTGWDLPLLDVSSFMTPTAEAIRETLSGLIDGAFTNHKFCKHISGSKQIHDFIQSGICECFTRPGRTIHAFNAAWISADPCICARQRYIECRHCGAMCAWFLEAGRIILSYQYFWRIYSPASPAWIGLLDEDSYRDDVLNEDSRHVLWCDTPGCTTGTWTRWEQIAKEEIQREWKEKVGIRTWFLGDCQEMLDRARDMDFKMPQPESGYEL